jgi:hypothetical protein
VWCRCYLGRSGSGLGEESLFATQAPSYASADLASTLARRLLLCGYVWRIIRTGEDGEPVACACLNNQPGSASWSACGDTVLGLCQEAHDGWTNGGRRWGGSCFHVVYIHRC